MTKNVFTNLFVLGVFLFSIAVLNSLGLLSSMFGLEFNASVSFTVATVGLFSLLSGVYGFIKLSEGSSSEEAGIESSSSNAKSSLSHLSKPRKIQASCVAFIIIYPAFLRTFFDLENQLSGFENFAFGIGVVIPLFGFWYAMQISNEERK